MAHEVENMFYYGGPPWHGLGRKIPPGKSLSIDEALSAAGLDWQVELKHLYTQDRAGLPVGLSSFYATMRSSDNSVLGIVGKDYKPLQNKDAFTWFQPFLDAGQATLETAGSLKHGRKVWVLAKTKQEPLLIGRDDPVENYVLLSNSHDGSLAVRAGFTPIRVVCNNTLCMAHDSEASRLIRIRHTANISRNLGLVQQIMHVARREFQATVHQYRVLSLRGITPEDLENYVRRVFNLSEDQESTKHLPAVVSLFENGRGSRLAGDTYWGAYNAVNEYLNYDRGKTQDSTLNSLWFGDSAALNKRALKTALEMAA
jgi:phage/plasmid-like protein (TIGR03299 family)